MVEARINEGAAAPLSPPTVAGDLAGRQAAPRLNRVLDCNRARPDRQGDFVGVSTSEDCGTSRAARWRKAHSVCRFGSIEPSRVRHPLALAPAGRSSLPSRRLGSSGGGSLPNRMTRTDEYITSARADHAVSDRLIVVFTRGPKVVSARSCPVPRAVPHRRGCWSPTAFPGLPSDE